LSSKLPATDNQRPGKVTALEKGRTMAWKMQNWKPLMLWEQEVKKWIS